MRVKLIVAYDGTNYNGWQVQPNGITIEEVLNRELSKLLKEDISVRGASRTDAGVHSLGNIAWFDTDTKMPAEKIAFALNQFLPDDITAQGSARVADDWNPHTVESKKTYEYRILNRTFRLPTERLYSHFYHYPLDVEKMDVAAKVLVGTHDFTSFASIHSDVKSFTRTIYEAGVTKENDLITFRITGNGFLYNMVRIITGTLIEIGGGLREVSEMREILDAKDRGRAGTTAPPEGLTMISWEETEGEND